MSNNGNGEVVINAIALFIASNVTISIKRLLLRTITAAWHE